MHVLTNECWRVVCFWLNLPKQTSPIVDATQGCGGKRLSCSTPPHSTHSVIVPGFQDNTRRWGKDLTLSRIRTPPCSRPADPPILDSSGAGSTNPKGLAGVSVDFFLPRYRQPEVYDEGNSVCDVERRILPKRVVDVPRLSRVLRSSVPGCGCQQHAHSTYSMQGTGSRFQHRFFQSSARRVVEFAIEASIFLFHHRTDCNGPISRSLQ
ncbi:hypothetical protein F5144DRAFT_188248 [Chaetomium tenue]|uniref:Uncharacterized protein n=1 Tax=Chaetomium tenue TaxID=1854479 RepID=A0ACB7PH11_9PEZI|nr:hypothetical protein F5144DRAFT_188248 [Chaetomium globosum]